MKYHHFLQQSFKSIINYLLPQSCFLCGHLSDLALCEYCLQSLPYLQHYCQRCGEELFTKDNTCGRCLIEPPLYTQIRAIFKYEYPVDKLIHAAKFGQNLAILDFLGKEMSKQLIAQLSTKSVLPDVLIPIPLHPQRLRERGYNQSVELAKIIAKQIHVTLNYTVCQRIRNTPHQTILPSKQRRRNLHKAFVINNIPQHWQYVALIDDVMTTGSTVQEVTRVLLQAGVSQVDVWCCART